MPYYVAGLVDREEALIARTPEAFREKHNINVQIRHEVTVVDPKEQRVLVKNLASSTERWEHYDQLLLATGAKPVRPPLEGIDSRNIYDVHNLVNGSQLKRALAEQQPRSAVIIGGGYLGLEMAEALHMRGLNVTMVQRSAQVMSTLDPDMGQRLNRALLDNGIDLRVNETVQGLEQKDGLAVAVTTDKQTIPADLIILGLGVAPNSDLAKDAGIRLGPKDSIAVNELQQTGTANIWAAGDCAQSYHLVSRRPVHIALGTVANKQGRVAGMNLGGRRAAFPGVVGTAITKFMDTECARTGLNEREIKALGLEYSIGMIETHTLPRYYPGSAPISVKVLAEKGSARLLGVQIVGGPGSAKRIDTAATALHAGFSLEELLYLDLSYAPPFAGVWDPIVIAARMALKDG
ncbi:MAG: FAD-dependent oxidoreductase [Desulfoprunum sp.]